MKQWAEELGRVVGQTCAFASPSECCSEQPSGVNSGQGQLTDSIYILLSADFYRGTLPCIALRVISLTFSLCPEYPDYLAGSRPGLINGWHQGHCLSITQCRSITVPFHKPRLSHHNIPSGPDPLHPEYSALLALWGRIHAHTCRGGRPLGMIVFPFLE